MGEYADMSMKDDLGLYPEPDPSPWHYIWAVPLSLVLYPPWLLCTWLYNLIHPGPAPPPQLPLPSLAAGPCPA